MRSRFLNRKKLGDHDDGASRRVGKSLFYSGEVSDELFILLSSNLCPSARGGKAKRLILNSTGGYVSSLRSIVDFLEAESIETIATGVCMSAAVPIVALGEKGKRLTTPSTRFMVHAPWGEWGEMNPSYMEAELREFKRDQTYYAQLLADNTDQSLSWWMKRVSSDTSHYFSAEEAVEIGIVDHIVDKIPNLQVKKASKRVSKKRTKKRTKKAGK